MAYEQAPYYFPLQRLKFWLCHYVTLGKLLKLSVPQFSYYKMVIIYTSNKMKLNDTFQMLRKNSWHRASTQEMLAWFVLFCFTLSIFIQRWSKLFAFTCFVSRLQGTNGPHIYWYMLYIVTSLFFELCVPTNTKFASNIFCSPWRFQSELCPLYIQQMNLIYQTPECAILSAQKPLGIISLDLTSKFLPSPIFIYLTEKTHPSHTNPATLYSKPHLFLLPPGC